MLEHGVRHADVTFRVFEIDGVNLVGHGGGANLAGDGPLLEVPDGDVAPDVAVKIEDDGVEPLDAVEQLGHVVVGFDLRDVRLERETERSYELFRHRLPVHVGVRAHVRVVVADGARHLAVQGNLLELRALPGEPVRHVGKLLAEGGGGRGLPVGSRHHRRLSLLGGLADDDVDDLVHERDHGVLTGAEHEGVGEVVDVLGGAREVGELHDVFKFGMLDEPVFDDVLDRLDVVVGGALHQLDLGGVRWGEVREELLEERVGVLGERGNLGDLRDRRELLEPPDLDDHARADEGVLGEAGAEDLDLGAVAAVDGGDGGEVGERQVRLGLEVLPGGDGGGVHHGATHGGGGAAMMLGDVGRAAGRSDRAGSHGGDGEGGHGSLRAVCRCGRVRRVRGGRSKWRRSSARWASKI